MLSHSAYISKNVWILSDVNQKLRWEEDSLLEEDHGHRCTLSISIIWALTATAHAVRAPVSIVIFVITRRGLILSQWEKPQHINTRLFAVVHSYTSHWPLTPDPLAVLRNLLASAEASGFFFKNALADTPSSPSSPSLSDDEPCRTKKEWIWESTCDRTSIHLSIMLATEFGTTWEPAVWRILAKHYKFHSADPLQFYSILRYGNI